MLESILSFLVMLNPIGLFLYLSPIRRELTQKKFMTVMFKATFISFAIYLVFLVLGDWAFKTLFNIYFDSFRIFGGIIIFSFAYLFLVKGQRAFLHMREDLDDLASDIALPFMVGAGTISLTILLNQKVNMGEGIMILVFALLVNFFVIMFLNWIRERIPTKRLRIAYDKNMHIFMRLNAFFMGAIGVNMIVEGVINLFL